MNTSTKIIIASTVLAGAATAVVVYRKRKQLAVYAEDPGEAAAAVASKAKDVVRKIVGKFGAIPGYVVQNFAKYGLTEIIDRHRGDFPRALAAAIIEAESRGYINIYNYAAGKHPVTGKTIYKVGYWDGQGDPPNCYACGVAQILKKYPRGLAVRELFDADKALAKMLPEWRGFYTKAVNAGLTGPDVWAAVYFGHNQGVGALEKGLNVASQGIEEVIKTGSPARNAAAALRVAKEVAAHAAEWAVIEDRVWSGQLGSALGSLVVDPYDYRMAS
jgi:hypothetical protein